MHDVAALAGVSIATVSRVLSGHPGVSATRRRAVLAACEELDYAPDALASALKTGSSKSIGIVIPDITNPFFPAVVKSAEHELAQSALDIVLGDSDNDIGVERQRIDTLLRRRVDALLVCPVHVQDSASALRSAARSTRVLQLDRVALPEADFVGVDHAMGMDQVVRHLLTQGARSGMFLGLHPSMSTIQERAAGFEDACRRHRLTTLRATPLAFPDLAHGRAAARKILDGAELPDAIVCANDDIASGVLMELASVTAKSHPRIQVTGYDDVPAAEIIGLTTVRQPLRQIGQEAARLLQQASDTPRHVRLQPTLVPRDSTTHI